MLYNQNIRRRHSTHDLEETIFHEAVHATLDHPMAASRAGRRAQRRDGGFVTEYAAQHPNGEDMAESALFAWAILHHPGRLPAGIDARVRELIPNRLAYFVALFTVNGPTFYNVGPRQGC